MKGLIICLSTISITSTRQIWWMQQTFVAVCPHIVCKWNLRKSWSNWIIISILCFFILRYIKNTHECELQTWAALYLICSCRSHWMFWYWFQSNQRPALRAFEKPILPIRFFLYFKIVLFLVCHMSFYIQYPVTWCKTCSGRVIK